MGKTIFGCGQSRDGRPVCWRSYDARAHVPILGKHIIGMDGLSLWGLLQRKTEIFVRNLQKIGIGHDPVLNAWLLSRGYQIISDLYFPGMEGYRLRAEAHSK